MNVVEILAANFVVAREGGGVGRGRASSTNCFSFLLSCRTPHQLEAVMFHKKYSIVEWFDMSMASIESLESMKDPT